MFFLGNPPLTGACGAPHLLGRLCIARGTLGLQSGPAGAQSVDRFGWDHKKWHFHGENDDKSVDGMGVRISVNVICEQYPMVVQVLDSSKVGETG